MQYNEGWPLRMVVKTVQHFTVLMKAKIKLNLDIDRMVVKTVWSFTVLVKARKKSM